MQLDERKESIIAAVNDEHARFKLWSRNIGAHRTGLGSLDHRLRDSSPLLSDSNCLVEAILSGKATPWDEEVIDGCDIDAELKEILGDEKFEFNSELDQLSVDIADIINSLLRLSTTIRNPAPHDHFMSTEYAEDSYFSDFDARHVEAKYKDANQDLRRRHFKYRESHHAKLSQGLDLDQGCTEAGEKSTVASSVPLAMKDPGNSAPLFGELDEDDHSETGNSQTSYATTAPESEKLRVPPLPEHGNKEYSRRHEWMDHVLQKHWKTWRCPGSCQGYWSPQASLKRHVQDIHSDIISTGDLNASIARNERMKLLDAKTECPLCKHPVDLALFALPKTGDREDSDDYDEMGDDKAVDSSEVDDDNNVHDNDEVTVDNGLDQADELDDQAELCTTERRGRHEMLQSDDSRSIPSKKQMPKASSHYQAKVNRAWQCVRITVYFNTRD
ncbi:zinc finger domain-containing protein [Metarhizium robertsii ARSEF 23]|uniref:Zinc finger domain-containing protein n=1 Tax=Metarhizium robertsii (strain ARSEF 23 / ATCC MYA-3075) TaxID=655844 RepID=E9EXL1_METRA|nr:zinc finger domain-containing protein [Metarhizium robertsii ARSEF 23]EFY99831.1 zinc finger domain-containing protein [Metarhizium robertsii ARSEF 23]